MQFIIIVTSCDVSVGKSLSDIILIYKKNNSGNDLIVSDRIQGQI